MKFEVSSQIPRIKILGLGKAGLNLLECFKNLGLSGIEFIHLDTPPLPSSSFLHLPLPPLEEKIKESSLKKDLSPFLEGGELFLILAGLGGDISQKYLLPLVREIKSGEGLAIVAGILPFDFEGKLKITRAQQLRKILAQEADALLIFSNNWYYRLFYNSPLNEFFTQVNKEITGILGGIIEPLLSPTYLPLDFPTLKKIIEEGGEVVLGWGEREGENRSHKVIDDIISCPSWQDINPRQIRRILISVQCGEDLTMQELTKICEAVTLRINPDALIAISAVVKQELENRLKVILLGIKTFKKKLISEIPVLEERGTLC